MLWHARLMLGRRDGCQFGKTMGPGFEEEQQQGMPTSRSSNTRLLLSAPRSSTREARGPAAYPHKNPCLTGPGRETTDILSRTKHCSMTKQLLTLGTGMSGWVYVNGLWLWVVLGSCGVFGGGGAKGGVVSSWKILWRIFVLSSSKLLSNPLYFSSSSSSSSIL